MSKKIDVIIQATDKMSSVINQVESEVESLGDKIASSANEGESANSALGASFSDISNGASKAESANNSLGSSFSKIATGATIAGAALSAFAQSQKEIHSLSNRTAVALGQTSGEFRALASEVSDASIPMDESIQLLQLAGRQGLKSKEELSQFVDFWGELGNASGQSAVELAKMSTGLRAVGIEAGNESEATKAYGTILKYTSMDLVKFNEMLSKNSETARKAGFGINEVAATYAYMQNELGYTAEMMESLFEPTIISSMGNIRSYASTLEDTSGYVKELADAHGESITFLDEFKSKFSEMALSGASVISTLGDVGSIMTGIGAASQAAAFFQGLYSAAVATTGVASAAAAPGMVTFGAGVVAATWPILAIVAAIALLVGAIYLLVKHFNTLKEGVSNTFSWMAENSKIILPLIFGPMFYMIEAIIKAIQWIGQNWDTVMQGMANAVKIAVDVITLPFKIMVNGIIAGINLIIDAINILGGSLERLEAFDLKVGDMNFSRSSQQTINVNTTTSLDGRAIAKSTASTTRRIAGSNN